MTTERDRHPGQIGLGVTLMLLGCAFLLQRMGMLPADNLWRWWPLLLVAGGVANLLAPRRGKGRSGGFWLLLVGSCLLLETQRIVRLRDSWPIFVVAAGASIAWTALRPRDENEGHHAD